MGRDRSSHASPRQHYRPGTARHRGVSKVREVKAHSQIGHVEVAEKYRSQFPKGIRADGWTPMPDSFGAEVGKALKLPEGYGIKPIPPPMP